MSKGSMALKYSSAVYTFPNAIAIGSRIASITKLGGGAWRTVHRLFF